MKAMFVVLLAVCAMAVAEETVDQSADEQFFHTYGYYPTAYPYGAVGYTAPVAVKTVKYAAPAVKTVKVAAPLAYPYGAYPYGAAYGYNYPTNYAVRSILPTTYSAYPYGAYGAYGAYPYVHTVVEKEEKKEE